MIEGRRQPYRIEQAFEPRDAFGLATKLGFYAPEHPENLVHFAAEVLVLQAADVETLARWRPSVGDATLEGAGHLKFCGTFWRRLQGIRGVAAVFGKNAVAHDDRRGGSSFERSLISRRFGGRSGSRRRPDRISSRSACTSLVRSRSRVLISFSPLHFGILLYTCDTQRRRCSPSDFRYAAGMPSLIPQLGRHPVPQPYG
jgi:hypothetical protein